MEYQRHHVDTILPVRSYRLCTLHMSTITDIHCRPQLMIRLIVQTASAALDDAMKAVRCLDRLHADVVAACKLRSPKFQSGQIFRDRTWNEDERAVVLWADARCELPLREQHKVRNHSICCVRRDSTMRSGLDSRRPLILFVE